jgi:transcriptional regulator with XRE-family HTH domain
MAKTEEDSSDRYDEVLRAVGSRLREARIRAGLTQKELGDKAGSKQSYIFVLETGGANITLRTLAKMADLLGIEIRDLLPERKSAPLSAASVQLLVGVYERIAALLSERERHDARLLAELRAFADLHSGIERALKPESAPNDGAASPPEESKSGEC